jgi:tRNA1Val (adenine37-N6)-methyltransferase
MILAWAAARACPEAIRVLDLGSGKGAVALLLLQRLPRCRVIGLEALGLSHDLALRNASLNGLSERWEPRLGDLRDPHALEVEESFDLITGAPPFMPLGSGVLPENPQRAAGRFELRGGVLEYAEAASRHLAQRGKLVLLMDGLERSRSRAERALDEVGLFPRRIVEVCPRPGRDPIYWVFEATRESVPAVGEVLCMRQEPGNHFSPAYEALRLDMACVPVDPTDPDRNSFV